MALFASQLAVAAAATLAKKTFEFSITTSLKGLSDVIKERFSNSKALQDAQAELEMKVKMLCLPVDILAHYATQGNTALQEPLGVALGVLEDVESFRQALVQQDVMRAQDAAASPDANAAQLVKRLRDLIARLDSVLPYLNLAISTVTLLNQGLVTPISPSRLMAASWRLRESLQSGAAVYTLPQAAWHEERQLTAAGPSMAEVFRLCSLTICRIGRGTGASGPAAAGGRVGISSSTGIDTGGDVSSREGWCYELVLRQELEDGAYHEPEESAGEIRLQVADVVALQCETTQSLNHGENEYRPALVLHVLSSGSSQLASESTAAAGGTAHRKAAATVTPVGATSGRQPGGSARAGSRASAAKKPGAAPAAGSGLEAGSAADVAGASPLLAGLSPLLVTPPAGGAAAAGRVGSSGVVGSIRRCAIMCSAQAEASDSEGATSEGEEEDDDSAGSAGSGSDTDSSSSSREGGARGARQARQGSGTAGTAAGSALRREWRLLGELEYVLRLCILECREQACHADVTDERILMSFQATSVPPAAAAAAAAATAARRGSVARGGGTAGPSAAAVEELAAGVRQLSFAHGGTPAAQGAEAGGRKGAAAGGGSGRRRGARQGKSGFGSPVQ